jgi:tripeptide aminopeptidase
VTAARPASAASELERRQLNATFAELCRIESPSGRERGCAERVTAELRALGVDVDEDGAGELTGSDCGNLHALVPGGAAPSPEPAGGAPGGGGPAGGERPSLLLCAHLDTVPLAAPVDPVLVDGHWENANAGILGADNKAAVAVLLAVARRVRNVGAPADVELLFTVGEETALAGARVFDASRLRSPFGYVFDHASPIGEVVTSSPSHFRVEAAFHGLAAHAGIRPEDGRSAIVAAARAIAALPHGRLDDETTVNVGTISGGSAMNVVAELCTMVAEVRSIDDERARTVVADLVDRVHEAANRPECDVDVDVSVERSFAGFRLPPSTPAVKVAESALRAHGFEPMRISSGGASDANALLAQGFQAVNLANGTERNHEPGERVSVVALEQMLDVALTLLDEAAALSL